jgi:homocysteine S-methyltransferase
MAAGPPPAIGISRAIDKPVIVYPNSGERWDGRAWTGRSRFSPRVGGALGVSMRTHRRRLLRGGPPEIAGIAALATALG